MKKSILNKIDSDAIHELMNNPKKFFPREIEYNETFNELLEKCPGLRELMHQANQAFMKGHDPRNQEDPELVSEYSRLYVQGIIAFNLLNKIHNIEEGDKLEKEMSGEVDYDLLNKAFDKCLLFVYTRDTAERIKQMYIDEVKKEVNGE